MKFNLLPKRHKRIDIAPDEIFLIRKFAEFQHSAIWRPIRKANPQAIDIFLRIIFCSCGYPIYSEISNLE